MAIKARITEVGDQGSTMFWLVLFIINCFVSNQAGAQTYPQDLDYSQRTEILLDAGKLWNINSIYHPLVCAETDSGGSEVEESAAFKWVRDYLRDYGEKAVRPVDEAGIGLNVLYSAGISAEYQSGTDREFEGTAFQPYLWLYTKIHEHWYTRFYVRATNRIESLRHYTGVPRDISRAGFNTGEIDQSIIGYRNKSVKVEFGRSREIWGPSAEDNLILSGETPAYERLLAQLSLGRITLRYQFGFLETVEDEGFINRYIVSRNIEYSNRRNLVLGATEVSILAGENRPLDLAFFNPLQIYLDTDLNNRSNSGTENYNNSIWALHFDWLALRYLRLSGSLAMDEFQLDQQDRKEGRPDVLGYLFRTAWTPLPEIMGLTIIGNYIRLDTYLGQHSYPYCNFVTRGEFIGHPIGNDADEVSLALRMVFRYPAIVEIELGRRRWGDNSLIQNPYNDFDDFTSVSFPSGEKRESRYMALRVNSQPIKRISLTVKGIIDLAHYGEGSSLERWNVNLRYQLPNYLTKL